MARLTFGGIAKGRKSPILAEPWPAVIWPPCNFKVGGTRRVPTCADGTRRVPPTSHTTLIFPNPYPLVPLLTMRFFLAGIMQGSHTGALLHDQDYRSTDQAAGRGPFSTGRRV